jgi:ABC-type antimicrobial peptide transport system permease subunit
VVGVVGNVKMQSMGEAPYAYLYLPSAQAFSSRVTLMVRTQGPPAVLAEPIRAVFASVNSNLPMLDARSMRENMAGAMFVQSTGATLLSGLGLIALLLAAVGLFAVLSYLVGLRRREIGIRMALGAKVPSVVMLVVGQAAGLVGLGLVTGGVLAFFVGKLLQSQLYGVGPADPVTFGSIALLVVLVGIAASLAPARRAASVDPVKALRSE